MLAAEKIVKFLRERGQGPGREPEGRQAGSQSVIRSGTRWLAGWLGSSWLVDAAWVTYVGESATHGVGGLQNLVWPPCFWMLPVGGGAKRIPSAVRPM